MTKSERLNLGISLLAAGLSVVSFGYTVLRDRQQGAESVVLTMDRELGDYKTDMLGFADEMPSLVALQWRGFLANTGTTPVSFTGYEVRGVKENIFSHSKMDLGLTDPDGNLVSFPLNLESGKAIGLRLRTGRMIPGSVSRVLASTFPVGTAPDLEAVVKHLARSGFDLFGNEVSFKEFPGGVYMIEGPNRQKIENPTYLLTLTTAKGNQFSSSFSYYEQGTPN